MFPSCKVRHLSAPTLRTSCEFRSDSLSPPGERSEGPGGVRSKGLLGPRRPEFRSEPGNVREPLESPGFNPVLDTQRSGPDDGAGRRQPFRSRISVLRSRPVRRQAMARRLGQTRPGLAEGHDGQVHVRCPTLLRKGEGVSQPLTEREGSLCPLPLWGSAGVGARSVAGISPSPHPQKNPPGSLAGFCLDAFQRVAVRSPSRTRW